MEYYLTLKRKEILTHSETKMNFGAIFSGVSQTDMISCIKYGCRVAVGGDRMSWKWVVEKVVGSLY